MTVSRKQILFLVSYSERVQNLSQKYLHKGMRIVIGGRISTGSYKDKDGKTIYTTDVVVEEHEFAQNKDSGAEANLSRTEKTDKDGFMEVPDGELPFD